MDSGRDQHAESAVSWRYEQSTGRMTSPDGSRVDTGYSGHPPHVNDSTAESDVAVGPIPLGIWLIHVPVTHISLGPVAIPLEPKFPCARSGFYIHGDNSRMDFSASHGCIILPRVVRELIAASGDMELIVS